MCECYQIGGRFIAEDPNCPAHGTEAQRRREEYDDAMAYTNLLHREKADLMDSTEEYKKEIATADSWVDKTLETKKIKNERAQKTQGGVIMDEKKPEDTKK